MCLHEESGHGRNRVQAATCWLKKQIFCILAFAIFKQIICGKYRPNGEFLTGGGLSKTMVNRSFKKGV